VRPCREVANEYHVPKYDVPADSLKTVSRDYKLACILLVLFHSEHSGIARSLGLAALLDCTWRCIPLFFLELWENIGRTPAGVTSFVQIVPRTVKLGFNVLLAYCNSCLRCIPFLQGTDHAKLRRCIDVDIIYCTVHMPSAAMIKANS
jgi:hypothetical protein